MLVWTPQPAAPCDHYATQPVDGTTVANPWPRPGFVECLRCGATATALSPLEQERALVAERDAIADSVPNGRDFERRADFDAAMLAHDARLADVQIRLNQLRDAGRRSRQGGI